MIDEVYFWERALSEDEVKELAGGAMVGAVAVEAQGKLATNMGSRQETLRFIHSKLKGSGFHQSRAFLFIRYL